MYFTLKDGGAQIKAVMFRTAVRYLRFKPEDGLHVVARGRLGVYEPKGEYQIVCEHMEPHGLGALQLAFEQLKKRLQAEGLFDAKRKRPLPSLPRRIGIVTSLDGAALRDILKVLRRRAPNAQRPHPSGARPGRRRGGGRRHGDPDAGQGAGRRRDHRRARRRVDRGSVGVQRRARRAGDRGLSGAGRLGGRPRGGLHDCRFRRRPPRADAVGGGGDGRRGERGIRRPHRPADGTAAARPRAAISSAAAPRCTC